MQHASKRQRMNLQAPCLTAQLYKILMCRLQTTLTVVKHKTLVFIISEWYFIISLSSWVSGKIQDTDQITQTSANVNWLVPFFCSASDLPHIFHWLERFFIFKLQNHNEIDHYKTSILWLNLENFVSHFYC